MNIQTLPELYMESLRDLFNAETQLIKALPKMAKAATSPDLKAAFESHLEQTKGHRDRIQSIFDDLGESPTGKVCAAMKGLLEEGDEAMKEVKTPEILDAALINAAQKVEHYEIGSYGTVRAFATSLGRMQDVDILSSIFEEETAADEKLSEIAEGGVNRKAAGLSKDWGTSKSSSNKKSSSSKTTAKSGGKAEPTKATAGSK